MGSYAVKNPVVDSTTEAYALVMNPVMCRAEAKEVVLMSTSKEELVSLLIDEKVNPYYEGPCCKQYRKGGPLEEYNPTEPKSSWGTGIIKVVKRIRVEWEPVYE